MTDGWSHSVWFPVLAPSKGTWPGDVGKRSTRAEVLLCSEDQVYRYKTLVLEADWPFGK